MSTNASPGTVPQSPPQAQAQTQAQAQASLSTTDAQINHAAALDYWSSIPATVDGVLGGYPQVSRVDLTGSRTFLAKLRRRSRGSNAPPLTTTTQHKLARAVDCGAGIGRVTRGFLVEVAAVVDVVEPVAKLADVVRVGADFRELRDRGCVGEVYVQGLQEWTPAAGTAYDLIWVQWCCGQVTDGQFVAFLRRVLPFLRGGGWIVVKENMSTDAAGVDIFDETDSSVTRHDSKFRKLFEQANLDIVATELQKGMPKELYPVRTYALQPREKS